MLAMDPYPGFEGKYFIFCAETLSLSSPNDFIHCSGLPAQTEKPL